MKKNLSLPSIVFLTWLFVLTLIPFFIIISMSFLKGVPYGNIYFSFDNYIRCFEWIYLKVFLKTLWLSATSTLSCLLIGFPVAYFLARSSKLLQKVGLVLLFIPFWTNFILRIYGVVSVLGTHGLLNKFLISIGLINEPLQILYTRLGVYIGLVYNYLPFLVIPIFSALEKLNPVLREAAFDLGASRIQSFWKVVVPNIKGGIFIGTIFVFIPMLGEYVIPDLLGGAREAFLGSIMVSQFYVVGDWPFGSAFSGVLSLILLGALFIQFRWQKFQNEK